MPSTTAALDLEALFGKARPSPSEVDAARIATLSDPAARRTVAARLEKMPALAKCSSAEALHRGLAEHLLGRSRLAAEAFAAAGNSAGAKYFLALSLMESGKPATAAEVLASVSDGEPAGDVLAVRIEALLRAGLADEARPLFPKGKDGGALGDDARARYLRGFCDDLLGDRASAAAHYAAALEADPEHAPTLLRQAFAADLGGDEERAYELYRRAASQRPADANALLNLGILHEDRGEFPEAVRCFKAVLDADPSDDKARLFLRDAEASQRMYYDEEIERKDDRLGQVMRTPITDFELSVRSRNCLAKMEVHNLGDLVRYTEQELLSHKNFGETSLQEIKDILAQKGLRLGMGREGEDEHTRAFLGGGAPSSGAREREELLRRPVGDLELSVRSKNCMQTLGVQTLGDLCQRSEQELAACKNFGQTSMNEIKQKLAEFGLMLRSDEEA
jgi:DNA-directed RNA polymerase subunit alpha